MWNSSDAARPEGEVEELKRIRATPSGWRKLAEVNNPGIGLFYICALFSFFCLLAFSRFLARAQLSPGNNNFLGKELYNQVFLCVEKTAAQLRWL